MAMTRVYNGFKKRGHYEDEARIVMNIHDEMVVQVHKSVNPWYALYIMREAMEMDFSADGFPPLYVGGNVGYTWLDGKADDLEAPVLLMDEKVAEVKKFLEDGGDWKDLPYYDDPKQMWADEIRRFSLRQVELEIEKSDLRTLYDFHEAKRALKYAKAFKNENKIFEFVRDFGWEITWDKRDLIENDPNPLKYNEADFITSSENSSEEDSLEITEDKEVSPEEYWKQHFKVIKSTSENVPHKLLLKLDYADSSYADILHSILLPDKADFSVFNEDQFFLNVALQIGESAPSEFKFKRIPSGMIPILLKYLKVHLFGGDYSKYLEDIDEQGSKIIKF